MFIETLQDAVSVLEGKLRESEAQCSAASSAIGEMVSREQVREMEGLFVDTVTKLSARVNFLEKQPANPPTTTGPPQSVQQQSHGSSSTAQYQPSNNNNSRIKIEPGGKIRAVSMSSGGPSALGIAGGGPQPSGAASRLPHSSSNDTILSNTSNTSGGSRNGAPKNKLW